MLIAGVIALAATLAMRKKDLIGLPHGPRAADADTVKLVDSGR